MAEYLQAAGTCIDDLDTPALLVDLPALERNVRKVADFHKARDAKLRPHIKGHKSPDIARIQIAAGGTNGGVTAGKLGEAEAMVHGGIHDVLIFNQITTSPKMKRLMSLARQAVITVAVDDPGNVDELSSAAQAFGATLGVCVEVDIGIDRCGVDPGNPALELARHIARAPGLQFKGLLGYEGAMPWLDFEERSCKAKERLQRLLDTRQMVEAAGLQCEIVGGGGSSTWNITGTLSGITEVQPGRYCVPDLIYQRTGDFETSLTLLTTVVSRPRKGLAVIDSGHKALHLNYAAQVRPGGNYQTTPADYDGLPEVKNVNGAKVYELDAEHGKVRLDGDAEQLRRGDKVVLLPAYGSTVFNQHDFIFAVRDRRVEAVWEISGARKYR